MPQARVREGALPPVGLLPEVAEEDAGPDTGDLWRKRLGVEPSPPAKRGATDFEDREGHRAPFASGAILRHVTIRIQWKSSVCFSKGRKPIRIRPAWIDSWLEASAAPVEVNR